MSIIKGIGKIAAPVLKPLANNRVTNYIAKGYEKDKAGLIAGVALSSLVFKDAVGGWFYFNQTNKNKKIPAEKRKFVAALDLANTVLMISSQIIAFYTVSNEKFQKKVFDTVFGPFFNRSARKGAAHLFKDINPKDFYNAYSAFEKNCRGAFKIGSSIIAATIIAKRMIVPFIATPVADFIKKHFLDMPPCLNVADKVNAQNAKRLKLNNPSIQDKSRFSGFIYK